ncbi:MAG: bifunctional isocitrate dehydrogenase kinase/phosphatase [Ferrovum sp. 37-45-19]|nr:MAG: bifunctional isocitrate dehydrogenase kinase/phosphatase [Ferrovum sp. 21-44-67]OYV93511.1 MAG: bifunctional isocitrate dehydrogenase kinase/phosphatase [Ferrovum sp. 37-45-19]OZB33119.1 MAG: bifunctional isocitrate dehydrogenase kinase/phosphatase [Ferrovum sp. 34-44-207]
MSRPNTVAQVVAQALLDGFNRHYRLFREASQRATYLFEQQNWAELQQIAVERIEFYDRRVHESVKNLVEKFNADALDDDTWQQIKLEYIVLLTDHKQPELAESFFNSVFCQILHRSYYNNDFIFVRAGVSTEHIDSDPPAYRCYYPLQDGLRSVIRQIYQDLHFIKPLTCLQRDTRRLLRIWRTHLDYPLVLEANHQIQILSSVFYRNTSAYLIGRMINGGNQYPFVVSLMHDNCGGIEVDSLLLTPEQLSVLVNSSRAYFFVDMEVPSAFVEFLHSMLPQKPKAELYSILGLHKQGKTLFYRDFLHHLKYSSDDFIVAPGIRGLVMAVFTLPSYPYVFKVIKDVISPPKQIHREQVKAKYLLVKQHDRVGRMADTMEYSNVAFPKHRFTQELLEELRKLAQSQIEETEDTLIIKHLYIERRMVPLNIYMDKANDEQIAHAIAEFGDALKDLAAVNIFAGDLLFKNFGVTRFGRVVFYDYDEIDYITNCHFRKIPPPRFEEDELSAEPWYSVDPNDIFPEEFEYFLLTDPKVRQYFLEKHSNLLDATWWQSIQEEIKNGRVVDVFPYSQEQRFSVIFKKGFPIQRRMARDKAFLGLASHERALSTGRKRPLGRFSFDSD